MAKSTSVKDSQLALWRGTAWPYSTQFKVALWRATAGEVSGTGYARQNLAMSTGALSAPAAGTGSRRQITNSADIDFGTAGAEWATSGDPVNAVRLYANDGTTLLYTATADASGTAISKAIQSGDPVKIPAGQLVIFEED
jgi:hypothetical protein